MLPPNSSYSSYTLQVCYAWKDSVACQLVHTLLLHVFFTYHLQQQTIHSCISRNTNKLLQQYHCTSAKKIIIGSAPVNLVISAEKG